MNKIILFVLITIVVVPVKLMAQEKNAYAKFGAGLFVDLNLVSLNIQNRKLLPGQDYFIEVGYKLKSNVILSGNYSYAMVKWSVDESSKEQIERSNYTFSTGYEFKMGKSMRFVPQAGLSYFRYYSVRKTNNGEYLSNYRENDLAFNVNLDGYFLYKENFILGLRIGSYYLYNLSWVEGIWITPVLGVKF